MLANSRVVVKRNIKVGCGNFWRNREKGETRGMREKAPQNDLTELLENIESWQQSHQKPTMNEIEEVVENELDKLRKKLIEKLAEEGKGGTESTACPECGTKLMKNGRKKRRLKGKGNQEIEIERKQLKCHQCGLTIFPPG